MPEECKYANNIMHHVRRWLISLSLGTRCAAPRTLAMKSMMAVLALAVLGAELAAALDCTDVKDGHLDLGCVLKGACPPGARERC